MPDPQELREINAYCSLRRREEIAGLGMDMSFETYPWEVSATRIHPAHAQGGNCTQFKAH